MDLISEASENVYWARVVECLVAFFGLSPNRARQRAAECRAQIDTEPDEEARVFVYHDEPFYVARDLAGYDHTFDLDNPERSATYDAILTRTRVTDTDTSREVSPEAPATPQR